MTYIVSPDFKGFFFDAMGAVRRANDWRCRDGEYSYGPHHWFSRISGDFELHPVVHKIVSEGVRPVDWHLLLLEWPHISQDDETQIAYTRNERAGESFLDEGSKRLTRTTIGKYLSRHWPHVPDHVRRDWAGTFGVHKYEIWEGKEKIISAVELGPRSCMKSTNGSIPFSLRDSMALVAWQTDNEVSVKWDHHPYAVYAPHLGWAIAVRLDPGQPDIVMGRCLVNNRDKVFVRSFKRGDCESAYSYTDERLEAWLVSQGYSRADDWEDYRMLKLPHPTKDGSMMPYLDGGIQTVDRYNSETWVVARGGEYECDNTDATMGDGRETVGYCEDCEETVYEDDEDRIHTGRHEDSLVCGCCARDYTYVRGAGRWRQYSEYYINTNDAVEVDGIEYDSENPPDNIVCCEDGEWRLREDCVECTDGEWYPEDSDDIVKCADEVWRVKDDCWESAEGNWYSEDEPQVEVAEGTYHPDELQAKIDNA